MKNFCLTLTTLFFLCVFDFSVSGQSIRINEIMTSNSSFNNDDDGDYSDWIELYNEGSLAIQLEGWGLSDNPSNPFKWKFPEYLLKPGGYLLVWASGKDRKPVPGEPVNGLTREVWWNIPGHSVQLLRDHPAYPESPDFRHRMTGILEAPSNEAENYGQRLYGLLKAPATGDFTFWIASADGGELWLGTDENQESLRKIADVPGWASAREWDKYARQKSGPVYLEQGKYYYLMVFMKKDTGGDNLSVRWQWPDGTMEEPVSGQHLFYTGALPLHTSFSIDAEGEEIVLTSKSGETVDHIPAVKIPANTSYGRTSGSSEPFGFFNAPSPGMPNAEVSFERFLQPPVFSHVGGFYANTLNLELASQEPGTSIIYTLDGTEPLPENPEGVTFRYKNQYVREPGGTDGPYLDKTVTAHIYTAPLQINNVTGNVNNISSITTTYDEVPGYIPGYPVEKAVVVKARVVREGALPSETVTHTYFVNDNGNNPFSLPVISISVQEDNLFDYDKGIYTAGVDFDNWRAANPESSANGGVPGNYKRRGVQWEYPASFELFTPDGEKQAGQNIGLRIHGGWSRALPNKSLRLYGRNLYGESTINYKFFEDQDDDAFKRLILRNSANSYYTTLMTDGAIQRMVRHLNVETQSFQPSVVFLNGEYWGMHHIRERYDKHYLARKFDIQDGKFDMLDNNRQVADGDIDHYAKTLEYIVQNGVENEEHYEYIKTRISTESFIDYMVAETFIANTDWPANNIKYWRLKTDGYDPDAGPGKDGRWRWMVVDTDWGLGMRVPYDENMLEFATADDVPDYPNPPWATFLLRSLLRNETFRNDFIIRYRDQLNTAFLPEVTKSVINDIQAELEPELNNHSRRWRAPSSMTYWKSRINDLLDFADKRPEYAVKHMKEFFNLEEDYNLTVDVSGANSGHVVVNTIPLLEETAGVPANPYPWSGAYFRKMPLKLEAVPAEGYQFVGWESNSGTYNDQVLVLHPEGDQAFTAIFRKAAKTDELIHYWNFNETTNLLAPSYTLLSASILPAVPSSGTSEITYASGQGFVSENARFGSSAGTHLRVNYPLGVSLTLEVPTTGFSGIKLMYETRRSGQGAGKQIIEYSANGSTYTKFAEVTVADDDPQLVKIDFSAIDAVNNNPGFKIRISFEQASGGTEGNNRFDNLVIEGIPEDGLNLPPAVLFIPEDLVLIQGEDFSYRLDEMFNDPDNDQVQYSVSSQHTKVVGASLSGSEAIFNVKQQGESLVKITAADGINTPVALQFRVLVYPEAFSLADGNFSFTEWNEDAPEMSFPGHMIFLQSTMSDPESADLLDRVYYITTEEYASDDASNIGFPYRNTRRTRINGLGQDGLSFINTGRDRDLGGALVAINTTGVKDIRASWLAGTILQNSRQYGLILQYRVGTDGKFKDVQGTGYISATDGNTVDMGPVNLPGHLLNHEYVQLLWRYHFLSGNSGPRAQLRLDDILIASTPTGPVHSSPVAGMPADRLLVYPNPFNQSVQMEIITADGGNADIGLYDLSGRKIIQVFNGYLPAGESTYSINAGHLPAGTYILVARTKTGVSRHKLIKN